MTSHEHAHIQCIHPSEPFLLREHAVQYSTVLECSRSLVVEVVECAGLLLFPILDGIQLVDPRPVVRGVSPKRDVQMLQTECKQKTQCTLVTRVL